MIYLNKSMTTKVMGSILKDVYVEQKEVNKKEGG